MSRRAHLDIQDAMRTDSEVVIVLSGELDMSTIPAVSQHVDTQLRPTVSALTLDLSDIAFMDSSGLRLLIELNDRAQREAWRLTLIGPRNPAAALVLEITGADTALPFEREQTQ
jgi:anti-anti-sigma factor